ncbi:MAG: prepilin-type N-terminal cleavage/methylation domain-containing protein [Sedimentisphaerales bacterium]|nr:prepilin-type N-terminal cleavage/methylation domain-containing protein [Sedimentisphaerales bacterium]
MTFCKEIPLSTDRKGFTLIELLVVISIIALLLSILLPVLGRARESAKKVVCLSNMRQMGIAVQCYLMECDNHLPPSSCRISDPDDYWLRILAKYTGETLLFRCPSDKANNFVDWNVPLDQQQGKRYSSFAVNALLDPVCFRYGGRTNKYNRVDNIRKPLYCIWISESPNTANFLLADHIHPESWEGSVEYAKGFIAWDRHLGKSNYLFADGRVENLEFEQTYNWPATCYWYPESAPIWPENP